MDVFSPNAIVPQGLQRAQGAQERAEIGKHRAGEEAGLLQHRGEQLAQLLQ